MHRTILGTIVDAVTRRVEELRPAGRLAHSTEPDALDQLLVAQDGAERSSVEITFTYGPYEISANEGGERPNLRKVAPLSVQWMSRIRPFNGSSRVNAVDQFCLRVTQRLCRSFYGQDVHYVFPCPLWSIAGTLVQASLHS